MRLNYFNQKYDFNPRALPLDLRMKFSPGQIAFVIFFAAIFIAAQIWSYRKDKSTNRKYYSGAWKVLLALIAVLVSLFFLMKYAGMR